MAPYQLLVSLFITLALTSVHNIGCCYVLKGSVTCVDCDHHSDLSGIKVSVKCSKLEKLATAITTGEDGTFETNLPLETPTYSNNCHAKILGGTKQMFVSRRDIMDTKVVKVQEDNYSYTISEPLKFYTKCPIKSQKNGKLCGEFSSSTSVDLPLPKEWGLAPTSYYLPVLPIIGIP